MTHNGEPPKDTEIVGTNERGTRVGQYHQRAVLSDAEVELIRQLVEEGMSHRKVAEKFDISRGTVSDIVNYRRRATAPVGWRRARVLRHSIEEETRLVEGKIVTRMKRVPIGDQDADNDA